MRKNILAFLAGMLLLGACASPNNTPVAIEARATPSINYQVVGSTKNTFMVVVYPADNKNRQALQQIGDYLCPGFSRCMVWYWDDVSKADTSYPVDPDKEEALIATYVFDFLEFKSTLKVFTLGDER
jgi:hypothetical protein